jgi:hypothetical protein
VVVREVLIVAELALAQVGIILLQLEDVQPQVVTIPPHRVIAQSQVGVIPPHRVIVQFRVVFIPPHREVTQPQVVFIPPHREVTQPQVVIIPPHRDILQPQVDIVLQVFTMVFITTSEILLVRHTLTTGLFSTETRTTLREERGMERLGHPLQHP